MLKNVLLRLATEEPSTFIKHLCWLRCQEKFRAVRSEICLVSFCVSREFSSEHNCKGPQQTLIALSFRSVKGRPKKCIKSVLYRCINVTNIKINDTDVVTSRTRRDVRLLCHLELRMLLSLYCPCFITECSR